MKDNRLSNLFTKRPKYQGNKTISFGKAKLDIIAGINVSFETWCTKFGYHKNLFNESELNITEKIDSRTDRFLGNSI